MYGILTQFLGVTMIKFGEEVAAKSTARAKANAAQAQQRVADQKAKEQRERDAAAQRERFEQERRAAFNKQYVTPDGCEYPQNENQFIECANHKMRAKNVFFAEYGTYAEGAVITLHEG
ncbi:hypothetical protein A3709_16780 [Halioglobus sp. HI00S01]|nr:hypothetical protein A3709_16780 [Halioglobus sp. HI00S01]